MELLMEKRIVEAKLKTKFIVGAGRQGTASRRIRMTYRDIRSADGYNTPKTKEIARRLIMVMLTGGVRVRYTRF